MVASGKDRVGVVQGFATVDATSEVAPVVCSTVAGREVEVVPGSVVDSPREVNGPVLVVEVFSAVVEYVVVVMGLVDAVVERVA